MTTVYVTRRALTVGIETMDTPSYTSGRTIDVKNSAGYAYYLHDPDWHTTPAKAVARAEEMRLKKIASLEKSLDKMRSLTFDLTSPKT